MFVTTQLRKNINSKHSLAFLKICVPNIYKKIVRNKDHGRNQLPAKDPTGLTAIFSNDFTNVLLGYFQCR